MSASVQDESKMTVPQQVAITITPAVSATLSLIGSGIIVFILVGNWKGKMSSPKNRFLFMLCLADIINSLWFCFWSLPIPEGTPGVWGALGNEATCRAQGFFLQIGVMGSFYNWALSFYFFASLTYGMGDEAFAKKHERWVHALSLAWPILTAIIALLLDLYSFSGLGCWIAPNPLRCHIRDRVECIRGENAYLFAWLFTGIPLIFLVLFILYYMYRIYGTVRDVYAKAEKIALRATRPGAGDSDKKSAKSNSRFAERSRETAFQAFLYVVAYAITHMWAFIVVIVEQAGGTNPFWVLLIQQFFWPLQGFCNVFIFLRPAITSKRKKNPSLPYWKAVFEAIVDFKEDLSRAPVRRQRTGSATFSQGSQSETPAHANRSTVSSMTEGILEDGDDRQSPIGSSNGESPSEKNKSSEVVKPDGYHHVGQHQVNGATVSLKSTARDRKRAIEASLNISSGQ